MGVHSLMPDPSPNMPVRIYWSVQDSLRETFCDIFTGLDAELPRKLADTTGSIWWSTAGNYQLGEVEPKRQQLLAAQAWYLACDPNQGIVMEGNIPQFPALSPMPEYPEVLVAIGQHFVDEVAR